MAVRGRIVSILPRCSSWTHSTLVPAVLAGALLLPLLPAGAQGQDGAGAEPPAREPVGRVATQEPATETALGAWTYRFETLDPRLDDPPRTSTLVTVASVGLRVDLETPDGDLSLLLERGDEPTLWLLDHGAATFSRLEEDTFAAAGETVGEAMEMLRAQLEALPADQRRQLEDTLAAQGLSLDPPPTGERSPAKVVRTGETSVFGEMPCDRWQLQRDKETLARLCVADHDQVPGSRELRQAFLDLRVRLEATFAPLAAAAPVRGPGLLSLDADPLQAWAQLDGVPVVASWIEGGEEVLETRLLEVAPGGAFGELLRVPEDYRRVDATQR